MSVRATHLGGALLRLSGLDRLGNQIRAAKSAALQKATQKLFHAHDRVLETVQDATLQVWRAEDLLIDCAERATARVGEWLQPLTEPVMRRHRQLGGAESRAHQDFLQTLGDNTEAVAKALTDPRWMKTVENSRFISALGGASVAPLLVHMLGLPMESARLPNYVFVAAIGAGVGWRGGEILLVMAEPALSALAERLPRHPKEVHVPSRLFGLSPHEGALAVERTAIEQLGPWLEQDVVSGESRGPHPVWIGDDIVGRCPDPITVRLAGMSRAFAALKDTAPGFTLSLVRTPASRDGYPDGERYRDGVRYPDGVRYDVRAMASSPAQTPEHDGEPPVQDEIFARWTVPESPRTFQNRFLDAVQDATLHLWHAQDLLLGRAERATARVGEWLQPVTEPVMRRHRQLAGAESLAHQEFLRTVGDKTEAAVKAWVPALSPLADRLPKHPKEVQVPSRLTEILFGSPDADAALAVERTAIEQLKPWLAQDVLTGASREPHHVTIGDDVVRGCSDPATVRLAGMNRAFAALRVLAPGFKLSIVRTPRAPDGVRYLDGVRYDVHAVAANRARTAEYHSERYAVAHDVGVRLQNEILAAWGASESPRTFHIDVPLGTTKGFNDGLHDARSQAMPELFGLVMRMESLGAVEGGWRYTVTLARPEAPTPSEPASDPPRLDLMSHGPVHWTDVDKVALLFGRKWRDAEAEPSPLGRDVRLHVANSELPLVARGNGDYLLAGLREMTRQLERELQRRFQLTGRFVSTVHEPDLDEFGYSFRMVTAYVGSQQVASASVEQLKPQEPGDEQTRSAAEGGTTVQ